MSNRKLPGGEIDEVERLREVRRELEREHGGREGFFAWLQELESQRKQRESRRKKPTRRLK